MSDAPTPRTLDPNADDWPTIREPIGVKDSNTTGKVRLQLEGDTDYPGLRAIALEADDLLADMRIFPGPLNTCADRPEAVCVKIEVADLGDNGAYALTYVWPGQPTHYRVIKFNTYYDHHSPEALAAHEFGHVLGLGHHARHGVCGGWPDELHFSESERNVLTRVYSASNIAARRTAPAPRAAGEPVVIVEPVLP